MLTKRAKTELWHLALQMSHRPFAHNGTAKNTGVNALDAFKSY